ncbi:MAG: hypothetical protein EXS08_09115 [Planctomycetes bacterium]|nr:hypothetical protein [Planctomycetota bacterium]
MPPSIGHRALALALLAAPLAAQGFQPVLRTLYPLGSSAVADIRHGVVDSHGNWMAIVSEMTLAQALVLNGTVLVESGDVVSGLPGAVLGVVEVVLSGATIELTLDGPVAPGALGSVQFSRGAAGPGDCGIATPFGELLIDPRRRVGARNVGSFASAPIIAALALPADPALVDLELFAQGAFVAPSGITLTNGLRLVIGAP